MFYLLAMLMQLVISHRLQETERSFGNFNYWMLNRFLCGVPEYLECGLLPTDKSIAQKVVLASKHYEMIDGVLHYEDPSRPGRWCVVVPKELRQQIIEEAHAEVFVGHFSERKV